MAYNPFAGAYGNPLSDGSTQRTASVKADGIAQSSPGDGSLMVGAFDRTAALQRHLQCNTNGSLFVGDAGGDGATLLGSASAALTARGLITSARQMVLDNAASLHKYVSAIADPDGATLAWAGIMETRDNGYWSAFKGRRFSITPPTISTDITAQATFAATTPTLLLRNAAASVRALIRSIRIVVTTASSNPVNIAIVLDTADRLSAGGSAITPQNVSTPSAVASAISSFTTNPTATAAGAGTRVIYQDQIPTGQSSGINIQIKDAWIIGTTGSFVVYIYDSAGAVAPHVFFLIDYEESA